MIRRRWLVVGAVLVLAVGVAAFLSYGVRGVGGSPGRQLAAWAAQHQLGQSIGTMVGDNRAIDRAVGRGGGALALHTVCGVLTTDAEKANGELPSPDTQTTQWLAQAYDLEYQAGVDCYDGASDRAKLRASASARGQAERLFGRVLVRFQALTGKTISTTTTTQPGGGILG